jgi:hypothetical protein
MTIWRFAPITAQKLCIASFSVIIWLRRLGPDARQG